MKALIKSTDGSGWVQVRAGDVVRFSTQEVNSLVCELPEGDNTSIILMDFTDNVSPKYWATPESCQLIERPFQVGDAYDYLENGKWRTGLWAFGIGAGIAQELNNNPQRYRHSSPLLRPVGDV